MTTKTRIETPHAPAAIGPYSQAIRVGDLVYTAGQLGIERSTGSLIEGGIKEQARQVLENLKAILEASQCSLDSVVKTTVFLTDMMNFGALNEVYKEYFNSSSPPARSTIQVSGLPLGAMVEIECVAEVVAS